jgi:hypothetical protein
VEFKAVWNTLVSSPPKPAFPNLNRLIVLALEEVEGGVVVEPTETVAELALLESALLIAVTVSVLGFAGAV